MYTRLFVVVCSVVLWMSVYSAGSAEACSRAPCDFGSFIPRVGSVPVNAEGIYWNAPNFYDGNAKKPTKKDILLYQIVGGARKAVDFKFEDASGGRYRIRPTKDWQPNDIYELETQYVCDYSGKKGLKKTARVKIGPKSVLNTKLIPVLKVQAREFKQMHVGTSSGSCTTKIDAAVYGLSFATPKELQPWSGLLKKELMILLPGQPGRRSWRRWGATSRSLYTLCKSKDKMADFGVRAGTYKVYARMYLVSTKHAWKSAEQSVTLSCDKSKPDSPNTPESRHSSTAGDSKQAGGDPNGKLEVRGCACQATPGEKPASLTFLTLFFLVLFSLRALFQSKKSL